MADVVQEAAPQDVPQAAPEISDVLQAPEIEPQTPAVSQEAPVATPEPIIPAAPKKQAVFLPVDIEFQNAKTFLSTRMGVKHPKSLYDHLTDIVQRVLEQKPNNAVDNLERISFEVKQNHASVLLDAAKGVVRDSFEPTPNLAQAQVTCSFLNVFWADLEPSRG
jgi:hypothetical protein